MNLKDDILIEHFLRNELSKKEITDFLDRLKTDSKFKEHFLIEKQLFQTLNEDKWSFIENVDSKEIITYKNIYDKSDALKQILKQENTNYQKNLKKKNTSKLIYFVAASIVAILFVISSVFNVKETPQNLYASYINNLDLPSLITRGATNNDLAKAQQYFEDKNYKEALPIFKEALINQTKQKATLYIYTGISQTELHKYTKAEKTLNHLINSDLLGSSKGYWYKMLLYLKMNDVEKAKSILTKITSDKSNYNYEEAQKMLQKL